MRATVTVDVSLSTSFMRSGPSQSLLRVSSTLSMSSTLAAWSTYVWALAARTSSLSWGRAFDRPDGSPTLPV